MTARVLHLVLLFALLLPGADQPPRADLPDKPYRQYFPLIGRETNAPCQVVYQNPEDGSTFLPETAFDARWTLRNSSGKTWRSDTTAIIFSEGTRVHTGADVRDLPYDVPPGAVLDTIIEMQAPAAAGTYVSTWAVAEGTPNLCLFDIRFQVP